MQTLHHETPSFSKDKRYQIWACTEPGHRQWMSTVWAPTPEDALSQFEQKYGELVQPTVIELDTGKQVLYVDKGSFSKEPNPREETPCSGSLSSPSCSPSS